LCLPLSPFLSFSLSLSLSLSLCQLFSFLVGWQPFYQLAGDVVPLDPKPQTSNTNPQPLTPKQPFYKLVGDAVPRLKDSFALMSENRETWNKYDDLGLAKELADEY
jgi:hypothetical protein